MCSTLKLNELFFALIECEWRSKSEVWRVLALKGAELAVNISAVPAHFPVAYMRRRMQGAAAIDQYHVAYVNRPGPVFAGGSAVYDPRDDELLALGGGEEVVSIEIDQGAVNAWRDEEIIFANRRLPRHCLGFVCQKKRSACAATNGHA